MADLDSTRIYGDLSVTGETEFSSFSGDGSGLTGTASLRATGTTKDDVGLGSVDNYSRAHYDARYLGASDTADNADQLGGNLIALSANSGDSDSGNDHAMILCPADSVQNVLGTLWFQRTSGHKGMSKIDILYGTGTTETNREAHLQVTQAEYFAGEFTVGIVDIGGTDYVVLRREGPRYFTTDAWFVGKSSYQGGKFLEWLATPAEFSEIPLTGKTTSPAFEGDGSGLTGTASLRATGTTKGDVGLGSVGNYSRAHYDGRYVNRSGDTMTGNLRLNSDSMNTEVAFVDSSNNQYGFIEAGSYGVRIRSRGTPGGSVSATLTVGSNGEISGDGSGLTGTASLRATGTTKGDVGLGNVPNLSGTSSANSNTLMTRNSSGDTWCRLFRSTFSSTNASIAGIYTTRSIGGDYMRPSTPNQVRSSMGIGRETTSTGSPSGGSDGDKWYQI